MEKTMEVTQEGLRFENLIFQGRFCWNSSGHYKINQDTENESTIMSILLLIRNLFIFPPVKER